MQASPPLHFVKKISAYAAPGYVPGMQQPSLMVNLAFSEAEFDAQDLVRLDDALALVLGVALNSHHVSMSTMMNAHPLLQRIARSTSLIIEQCGIPVFGVSVFLSKGSTVPLALPTIGSAYDATDAALDWVVALTNAVLSGRPAKTLIAQFPALMRAIRDAAPQGMNTLRFIEAAQQAGIPLQFVANNVYRFGWGSYSRQLDSSFSDKTPQIAAQLARNKMATAQVLRRFQVPVPQHALARSEEQAVRVAQRLSFPVVVKPADQDGGVGVASGLMTEEAVKRAYAHALKFSSQILVEKHFEGNDYRLQVFNDRVIWATHRVPGGVTGDGVLTVTELLALLNADPKRGAAGSNAVMKTIALDEEALELLAAQTLAADSVPAAAQFVRLRRNANVASGGVPLPVLEDAHPDNLTLATRAARALGLDIAGVDLLIPDIRRSWLESGAVVCEVNGQPQMYPHLPAHVLGQLVQGEGRIPVCMVLGKADDMAWLSALEKNVCTAGRNIGIATPNGIRINGALVSSPCNAFEGARALLADVSIDAVIILLADTLMLNSGCAVDRFNLLALFATADDASPANEMMQMKALIHTLALRASSVMQEEGALVWQQAETNRKAPACLSNQSMTDEIIRIAKGL